MVLVEEETEDEGALGAAPPAGEGLGDYLAFDGTQPIQRHLVCDHAYDLNDIAVRVREGSLARRECRGGRHGDGLGTRTSFWTSDNSGVVLGTLGGAVVAGVPVGREEASILHRVTKALVRHSSVLGASLGASHDRFRGAFGEQMNGTVDGDLLQAYCRLGARDQERVATAAGFPGPRNAQRIVDLLHGLSDRAA
jgi:hypothetical protein